MPLSPQSVSRLGWEGWSPSIDIHEGSKCYFKHQDICVHQFQHAGKNLLGRGKITAQNISRSYFKQGQSAAPSPATTKKL
jgi:hypothetical protein